MVECLSPPDDLGPVGAALWSTVAPHPAWKPGHVVAAEQAARLADTAGALEGSDEVKILAELRQTRAAIARVVGSLPPPVPDGVEYD